MKYIYTLLLLILFLVFFGFGIKNAEPVDLHYYLGLQWHQPLYLLLAISFLLGILLGLIACITPYILQRRRLIALQRELKNLGARIS